MGAEIIKINGAVRCDHSRKEKDDLTKTIHCADCEEELDLYQLYLMERAARIALEADLVSRCAICVDPSGRQML